MYKNRISRTTTNRHPQFFIRRSDIAFDERVKYVESVCATLIESRFGPGRVAPVQIDFSDRPEPDPTVFYDLCVGETNPGYALALLPSLRRRAGYKLVEAAYRMAKQMGRGTDALLGSSLPSGYSSNLGRGSP